MTDSQARHPETPHHAPEPTLNRWHRKSFRIDRGGGSPGADGSLMRSFQGFCTPAGGGPAAESKGVCPSPVTERRAEERVHQPECRAWVSWKNFWTTQTRGALLTDISRGGARLFVDEAPPTKKPFWVFLEANGERAVVRAEVREVDYLPRGQCVVRVKFLEPCPYTMFDSAVCGMAAADPRARAPRASGPQHSPPRGRPAHE